MAPQGGHDGYICDIDFGSHLPVALHRCRWLVRGGQSLKRLAVSLYRGIMRLFFAFVHKDAIMRALEPAEKAAAKERMSEGGVRKVSLPSGQARDKIGAFAGVSVRVHGRDQHHPKTGGR